MNNPYPPATLIVTKKEIRQYLIVTTLITVLMGGFYYSDVWFTIIKNAMFPGIVAKMVSIVLALPPVFLLVFVGFFWVKFTKSQYDRVMKMLKIYWIVVGTLFSICYVIPIIVTMFFI